jgi:hypothetical protein
MTSNMTITRIATTIIAIRRPLLPRTNPFREKALGLEKRHWQYLQVSACWGQMPPQFGQVCANTLSDIFQK